jgi:hypothetical protein
VKITRKTNEWMQHVRTMDGPRRSYASVKCESTGKRKPRRLLEISWKHYYYYYYHHHHHYHHYLVYAGYLYIYSWDNIPWEYIVAAILLLLFMVPISLVCALALLYFYVSTFRSMCTVPNMAVFCSSLTSWFPGMLLTYFLNDFEMVPVAPLITGYHPCFYIPHALYFYCKFFIF